MHQKKAENKVKIISLVPSWTESLIEAGVDVVGRTRFCIHPALVVKSIPAVGGTKNLKIDEILKLKPDYVILDKEENKLEMAEALKAKGIQILVSQVDSIVSAADFLEHLAGTFENLKLMKMSQEYRHILEFKNQLSVEKFWRQSLKQKNADVQVERLKYVIWKSPFMLIGKNTFIDDVFSCFGLQLNAPSDEKYPQTSEEDLKKGYCLFSSEPYSFENHFVELTAQGYKGAVIDGEKISWYGVRNLNFLKACFA